MLSKLNNIAFQNEWQYFMTYNGFGPNHKNAITTKSKIKILVKAGN